MNDQNRPEPAQTSRPVTLRGIRNIAAYCGSGISHYRVRDAIARGDIPVLGTGTHTAVLSADIDAWLLTLRTKRASA